MKPKAALREKHQPSGQAPRVADERQSGRAAAVGGAGFFEVYPERLTKLLLVVVACLIAIGIVASFLRYDDQYFFSFSVAKTFNLNLEANVPTWFSTLILFTNAALLAIIAAVHFQARDPWRYYWCGLSFVFVYLSMDEAASFHERTMQPLRQMFDLSGPFYYAWVIPAAVCLLIFGMLYMRFTLALPRRTMIIFVLAAVIYVGGAMGVEMISAAYNTSTGHAYLRDAPLVGIDVTHDLIGVVEESMEKLGMVIFFYGLMDYMRLKWGNVTLRL